MKNFTRFAIACAFVIQVFTPGCSEDVGVTPAAEKQYYPMTTGSYKVIRDVSLDANGEIANSLVMDSSVVGQQSTYANQSAYMQISYMNGVPVDTMWISNTGKTAMWFYSPVSFQGLSPVEFPARWVKMGDFNDGVNSWQTFDTTVTNVPVQMAGQSTMADATIKQTITKGSMVTISYGANPVKTVSALEFTAKTSFDASIKTQIGALPLKFDNVEKLYFADGIGLVQHKRDYYELSLAGFTQPVYGFNRTLHHFHTK